jgi:pyruvate kinase
VLDVDRVAGHEIVTTVRIGGELSNSKGINRQGGGLSAPALTAKDVRDIETAMECGADYVAVSSSRTAPTSRWRAGWPPSPARSTASGR